MLAVFERVLLLEDVELFEPLGSSDLLAVAQVADIECFSSEMVVCRRALRDDRLFVIVSGEVRLMRAGRMIASLRPYDCFGGLAWLDDDDPMQAVSSGDVICLSVTRTNLEQTLGARPAHAQAVIDDITLHLRTRLQLPFTMTASSA